KQKGERNSQYGKVWITKDNMSIKINKELLEDYMKKGWIRGRKNKEFIEKQSKMMKNHFSSLRNIKNDFFNRNNKIKIFIFGNILEVEEKYYWYDYMFEGWMILKKIKIHGKNNNVRIKNKVTNKNQTIDKKYLNYFLDSGKWERGFINRNHKGTRGKKYKFIIDDLGKRKKVFF
ncbi:MAG: hypothetical protein NZZ41_04035, partial [Candidatus Dojkabacteria bacterium]|nr:hypothetical protein [Candidatus Dojkabacteria bacterium]